MLESFVGASGVLNADPAKFRHFRFHHISPERSYLLNEFRRIAKGIVILLPSVGSITIQSRFNLLIRNTPIAITPQEKS
jgi:hypothetical protein